MKTSWLRVLRLVVPGLVALAGCTDPAPRPETPAQRRLRFEQAILDTGSKDPWPYYELGVLDEMEGDLERAVNDYGTAVALLPQKKVTRPALALARVHAKLGHPEPARRLYEEVVQTVASDPERYKTNPDYREAALALKDLYAKSKDVAAAKKLRERFLTEMNGTPEEWPQDPD